MVTLTDQIHLTKKDGIAQRTYKNKKDGFIKIIGRESDVINVGGLKSMPAEVEKVCLKFKVIIHAKALGRQIQLQGNT